MLVQCLVIVVIVMLLVFGEQLIRSFDLVIPQIEPLYGLAGLTQGNRPLDSVDSLAAAPQPSY